jgi:hypothetical protein
LEAKKSRIILLRAIVCKNALGFSHGLGPEATKVVNGLLIGSASEAGTAELD